MARLIPTARELQALKVLWELGEATVQDLWDRIGVSEGQPYTTVLSLLQSMEQKGLVRHRRVGKAYVYSPKVGRASTIRRVVSGFLDSVFDGAMDQYLAHALQSRNLREEELQELENMIADARREASRKRTKGADRG